jgi:hypothetical protein
MRSVLRCELAKLTLSEAELTNGDLGPTHRKRPPALLNFAASTVHGLTDMFKVASKLATCSTRRLTRIEALHCGRGKRKAPAFKTTCHRSLSLQRRSFFKPA